MAFVKMRDALGKIITVPHGAVKAYKGLGFAVVDEQAVETAETENPNVEGEGTNDDDDRQLTEEEAFIIEMEKKPLAQWNKEEVKTYAAYAGVDISGTKNAQEAKERIKAYIDEKADIE